MLTLKYKGIKMELLPIDPNSHSGELGSFFWCKAAFELGEPDSVNFLGKKA